MFKDRKAKSKFAWHYEDGSLMPEEFAKSATKIIRKQNAAKRLASVAVSFWSKLPESFQDVFIQHDGVVQMFLEGVKIARYQKALNGVLEKTEYADTQFKTMGVGHDKPKRMVFSLPAGQPLEVGWKHIATGTTVWNYLDEERIRHTFRYSNVDNRATYRVTHVNEEQVGVRQDKVYSEFLYANPEVIDFLEELSWAIGEHPESIESTGNSSESLITIRPESEYL